jgi:hypothetical protein
MDQKRSKHGWNHQCHIQFSPDVDRVIDQIRTYLFVLLIRSTNIFRPSHETALFRSLYVCSLARVGAGSAETLQSASSTCCNSEG